VKEKRNAVFVKPIDGPTQDLGKFMQTELRVMTPVIKRTGIKVDRVPLAYKSGRVR
jgi:hypothetical protein